MYLLRTLFVAVLPCCCDCDNRRHREGRLQWSQRVIRRLALLTSEGGKIVTNRHSRRVGPAPCPATTACKVAPRGGAAQDLANGGRRISRLPPPSVARGVHFEEQRRLGAPGLSEGWRAERFAGIVVARRGV